jgi:predicted nucleic acid-binding protein
MPLYFVDTWFFIAQAHEGDSDHRSALAVGRKLRGSSFVTHDGVLTELLAFVSGYGEFWRKQTASFARGIINSREYHALPLSRAFFLEALSMYERRLDKEYSLVDCMSMIAMRSYGITHALTNDHHFEQEGFVLVNQ